MGKKMLTNQDIPIQVARIYLSEADQDTLHTLLDYLHNDAKVCGVTVFRGISGFGHSRRVHEARLLDLAMDLPIVVEFFDKPEQMQPVLTYLQTRLEPGHLIYWSAFAHNPC